MKNKTFWDNFEKEKQHERLMDDLRVKQIYGNCTTCGRKGYEHPRCNCLVLGCCGYEIGSRCPDAFVLE